MKHTLLSQALLSLNNTHFLVQLAQLKADFIAMQLKPREGCSEEAKALLEHDLYTFTNTLAQFDALELAQVAPTPSSTLPHKEVVIFARRWNNFIKEVYTALQQESGNNSLIRMIFQTYLFLPLSLYPNSQQDALALACGHLEIVCQSYGLLATLNGSQLETAIESQLHSLDALVAQKRHEAADFDIRLYAAKEADFEEQAQNIVSYFQFFLNQEKPFDHYYDPNEPSKCYLTLHCSFSGQKFDIVFHHPDAPRHFLTNIELELILTGVNAGRVQCHDSQTLQYIINKTFICHYIDVLDTAFKQFLKNAHGKALALLSLKVAYFYKLISKKLADNYRPEISPLNAKTLFDLHKNTDYLMKFLVAFYERYYKSSITCSKHFHHVLKLLQEYQSDLTNFWENVTSCDKEDPDMLRKKTEREERFSRRIEYMKNERADLQKQQKQKKQSRTPRTESTTFEPLTVSEKDILSDIDPQDDLKTQQKRNARKAARDSAKQVKKAAKKETSITEENLKLLEPAQLSIDKANTPLVKFSHNSQKKLVTTSSYLSKKNIVLASFILGAGSCGLYVMNEVLNSVMEQIAVSQKKDPLFMKKLAYVSIGGVLVCLLIPSAIRAFVGDTKRTFSLAAVGPDYDRIKRTYEFNQMLEKRGKGKKPAKKEEEKKISPSLAAKIISDGIPLIAALCWMLFMASRFPPPDPSHEITPFHYIASLLLLKLGMGPHEQRSSTLYVEERLLWLKAKISSSKKDEINIDTQSSPPDRPVSRPT